MVREFLQRGARVNIYDVLFFGAVIIEIFNKLHHFWSLIAVSIRAARDLALWLGVRVAGAVGLLVITIARTVHSLQLVSASRCCVLRNDLRLEEQVVFFLDALNIKDLERVEYEAQKHNEHVANEVEVVHARQPVVVRDRVRPVEEAHVAVPHCHEDVEGDQQDIIQHNADWESLQEEDEAWFFVRIREEF